VAVLEAHQLKWNTNGFPDLDVLSPQQCAVIKEAQAVVKLAELTRCESLICQTLKSATSSKTQGRLIQFTAQLSADIDGQIWSERCHPELIKLVAPLIA
jgi:hypothetical protein